MGNDQGQAVIIANTITDHEGYENWHGIYFRGKERDGYRGVVLNHGTLNISKEEYIPDGFVLDVLDSAYKNQENTEKTYPTDIVSFENKECFTNYGTIYVFGTYDNLDENELTNKGKIYYLPDYIALANSPLLRYHVGSPLDLSGLKVSRYGTADKTGKRPVTELDETQVKTSIISDDGREQKPVVSGTILQPSDDAKPINIIYEEEEPLPFDQADDPTRTAEQERAT